MGSSRHQIRVGERGRSGRLCVCRACCSCSSVVLSLALLLHHPFMPRLLLLLLLHLRLQLQLLQLQLVELLMMLLLSLVEHVSLLMVLLLL